MTYNHEDDHPPGPQTAQASQGPIKLSKTFPLITSPLTPDASAFNAEMRKKVRKWWGNSPVDNTTKSDPDTDFILDCEPVGERPPVDGPSPSNAKMLPGIISVACGNYTYWHGAAHGGGDNWGFNWCVHKRREVRASDVFNVRTKWLAALTALVDADRGSDPQGLRKLDFSDTGHWVISSVGLGLTYSHAEFANVEDAGMGMIDFIPWSKLKPYLNPHGIVPQSDWNATLPSNN